MMCCLANFHSTPPLKAQNKLETFLIEGDAAVQDMFFMPEVAVLPGPRSWLGLQADLLCRMFCSYTGGPIGCFCFCPPV